MTAISFSWLDLTFSGGHTEIFWRNALKLSLQKQGENLFINIQNPQPHNLPSGFGGREILVEIKYFNGTKKIDTKVISLTTHYKRKRGKTSIAHTALKASKDLSIPAYGSKKFKIAINPDANVAEVTLYYRLVNDEIRNLLNLKDPIWSKKFFITSKTLNLN